jgi:heme/copper-type cytochrome/quinol oxidase subunit 2
MKYFFSILVVILLVSVLAVTANAQCSVCTKTSMQLGEKPAQGMNTAILYLMLMPFAIVGFIGYRWWRGNKKLEDQESKPDNRQ